MMSKLAERKYLAAVYSFLPFGPARTQLLIRYFKSAKNVWKASDKKLLEVGLKRKVVNKFSKYRKEFDHRSYFRKLKDKKIGFVTILDKDYPKNLVDLDDAPPVLYYRGDIGAFDENAVAMVGSRKISSYGREVTKRFATEFASYGVTVISGLAFGIDAASHKAALDAGGNCIAVLASSVDDITPRSNQWLGKKIIKSGGLVVSEYPLGTEVQKGFFPFRNRIISGLSKAVIVVEGMEKSGTLHTASHAAKQGREVFAVPGQITSPLSGAPHFLIKNGSSIAFSVKDVLDELDLQLKVDKKAVEKIMPSDELEEKILEVLENEEKHKDVIARKLTLSASEISAKLTMMELKGLVKNIGGGEYKKS
jgi:DNA processing protein